ncbi:MAG: hypothetical protein ACP5JJ_07710 [Anaerolineae bacterium]
MTNRILALIASGALLLGALLGCSIGSQGSARITATPTKTLRPLFTSTSTPTPSPVPTDTPLPTDTAVPPTDTPLPTETPSPTLGIPTDTPAPPTDTPTAPANTPQPRPTNTPAPPTNTPRPSVDYRVVQQDLVPKQENLSGLYTIFVRVETASGNPVDELVIWDPNQPAIQAVTGEKPDYYHAEYLMGGGDYYLEVKDARSEKTKRLTTVRTGISNEDLIKAGYCVNDADCDANVSFQHFSWRVVFRRTW